LRGAARPARGLHSDRGVPTLGGWSSMGEYGACQSR
jgi:hypothetical protein